MKILVTGGSGFVGSRIISKFVKDGHEVFALVRSPTSEKDVVKQGASAIMGNLEETVLPDMPAIDVVVHAAAHFRLGGPQAPFYRTNVIGTENLLKAAKVAGAKTFVYISAAGIVMDDKGTPVRNVNEDVPIFPNSFSAYIASKAQAEKSVLSANEPTFRTISLRPPAIWGRGDMFSREIPSAVATGNFAFIDQGKYPFSTCHVDNVVEAVECALESDKGGRAYFVRDQETKTFRTFISVLAGKQGLSIEGIRSVPYWLAWYIGRVMEFGAFIMRSKDDPPLSRAMVRLIGREFSIDDSAARHELGYRGLCSYSQGLAAYDE